MGSCMDCRHMGSTTTPCNMQPGMQPRFTSFQRLFFSVSSQLSGLAESPSPNESDWLILCIPPRPGWEKSQFGSTEAWGGRVF